MNSNTLTPREREIVQAIGEALTNRHIAARLRISEHTVKHHLTTIFQKVGVESRLQLAVVSAQRGLIAGGVQ